MTEQYVELHARSAFSFLRGAATPEELIAVCAELKMPAMALLDNDGVYGAARFHLAAKKIDIKAHIGAEITVSGFKSQVSSSKSERPLRGAISNFKFQIPKFKFQIQEFKLKTQNSKLTIHHSPFLSSCAIAPAIKISAV